MSNALPTQGFYLHIGSTDSPSIFTEVKEVTSFTGFDGQAAEIDVTHLQSTAKEFLMGLQDFGSFNCDVNHLPHDPGQQALRASKATRTIRNFRITFSDGNRIYFDAYVLANSLSGGVDAKVDGSFSLRITGEPQFT